RCGALTATTSGSMNGLLNSLRSTSSARFEGLPGTPASTPTDSCGRRCAPQAPSRIAINHNATVLHGCRIAAHPRRRSGSSRPLEAVSAVRNATVGASADDAELRSSIIVCTADRWRQPFRGVPMPQRTGRARGAQILSQAQLTAQSADGCPQEREGYIRAVTLGSTYAL